MARIDLREIDVRCELTLEQVEKIRIGQSVEIRKEARQELLGIGRVVFVGIEVDARTELVPVIVRLANPDDRLRSGEPVQTRFVKN